MKVCYPSTLNVHTHTHTKRNATYEFAKIGQGQRTIPLIPGMGLGNKLQKILTICREWRSCDEKTKQNYKLALKKSLNSSQPFI